ncbi:hypothetical protein, partial [Burkholderia thailandensis]|uniref:hypothetical protein n=1 Tax=Burkholderia thailandensis TaxID=57975 RepID=UPI001F3427BA
MIDPVAPRVRQNVAKNDAGILCLAGAAPPETVRTTKKKVHRRKPWSLGERLRNLTPDFMDVRR